MLTRLAHVIVRHRRAVIGAWLVLTLFGVFAAGQVSTRWYQSLSIPGKPAYEASQRTLNGLGVGARPPSVVAFHTSGDATKSDPIRQAMRRAAATMPGARTSSYFSTGNLMYVSRDRHTTFAEVYPPGAARLDVLSGAKEMRAAAASGLAGGITVNVTGRDALGEASMHGSGGGSSVLLEAVIGGVGALVILLFVFGTLPAVMVPLAVAIAAILNTFTLVWALTYITDVSIIVQFLIALVGLGVAIDYALLMIFRFRDELREGADVEVALTETMTHAGRSVIVSGSTVALGLLSMVALPLPLLRSVGIGGMLIPAVSVLAAITLLPALLAVLGERINSVRLMPKRLVDHGHPEDGAWGRWARFVLRRPVAVAAIGLVMVAVLAGLATQLNPSEAQLSNFPGTGTAIAGRQMLADAQISPGVMKPLNVLVEHGGDAEQVAAKLRTVPGVVGASAPPTWRRGDNSLVEAFPAIDGSAPGIQAIIDRTNGALQGTDGTLTGIAAVDRDFVHALFGSAPYVLALVLLLTLILLTRAFRSVVLAIKAVVLNVLSLAAAFGIVVFVFQQGHGSSLWNIEATQSITAYIPVMIFAFLYGLSMDYEVFMLSRMREAYDETGSTDKAIELGLARTGQARDQRRPDPHVRVPGALHEPRLRDQAPRDRHRRRHHLRRHGHPRPARAGADATARRRQLVDAQLDEDRSASPPRARAAGRGRERIAHESLGTRPRTTRSENRARPGCSQVFP
ncbi:MAG TPA: MMPL family transporter [Baekduia sp.]|uniref:MMPL family transporter n=1 Tax=Baekduia sp. TaxID=2600305 RepID=UPI002D1CF4F8|nr:MMPL family transporter [Baekduia sp.]HMJ34546.1 MMPL family transporter [Baekduia sp.]